jgi:hypothetical protein
MKKKVYHINTSPGISGAAIAAQRLVTQLNISVPNHSQLLYSRCSSEGSKLSCLRQRITAHAERLCFRLVQGYKQPFSTNLLGNRSILDLIEEDAIIHIHWIGAGGLSLHALSRIPNAVVITAHDYWLFNYASHLRKDNNIGRFQLIDNYLSRLKRNLFDKDNLRVIFPSKWMLNDVVGYDRGKLATKSCVIPNISSYSGKMGHLKQEEIRKWIEKDSRPIIGFFASDLNDPNKNFNFFLDLSQHPHLKNDFKFIAVGNNGFRSPQSIESNFLYAGLVTENQSLTIMDYIDAVVVPSYQETFSLVAVDASMRGKLVFGARENALSDLIELGVASEVDLIDVSLSASIIKEAMLAINKNHMSVPQSAYGIQNIIDEHLNIYSELAV